MKKERETRKRTKPKGKPAKATRTAEQETTGKSGKRQRKKTTSGAQQPQIDNRKKALNPKVRAELAERVRENNKAIEQFKRDAHFVCSFCGKEIEDWWSAVTSKEGSGLVHFECALSAVSESEKIEADEKVSYIGNGRFAVIKLSDSKSPKGAKRFSIRKVVNWEAEGQHPQWRQDIAALYGTIL